MKRTGCALQPRLALVCAALAGPVVATALAEIPWLTQARQPVMQSTAGPADALLELAARTEARHTVIRFEAPLPPRVKQRVEAAGVRLLDYVGDNAYFAALDAVALDAQAVVDAAAVRDVTGVEPEWKLHPFLAEGVFPSWAVVVDGDDPVIGAYVVFYRDVNLDAEAAPLMAAYGADVRDTLESINGLVFEAPLSALYAMADEDLVQWVQPAMPRMAELNAENRTLTGANIVQAAPYGLDGAGVVVLVYDGGTVRATHQDFGGRLTNNDGDTVSDHSTHVAATIGGSGAASGGNNRGMAPGCTLRSMGFEWVSGGVFLYDNPGDFEADYANAMNNLGAVISNNSIGSNVEINGFPCAIQGDYGLMASLIDGTVRGSLSDDGTPFRIVWAAGNERQGSRCDIEGFGDYYSVAPPGGAKNHLSVGAVNANNDSMTTFSSWGPTDDGRLKPDIVAPGCQSGGDGGVTSAGSSSDTSYSVKCGTSMASPTACGLAALIIQDYRAQFPGRPDPRNATLKVLFAHNAVDLGNPGPDYQFGYGSVRIQPTIDYMRSENFVEVDDADGIQQGDSASFTVEVVDADPELKVTLAWDDVPAVPNAGVALVNNLDLVVIDPLQNEHRTWSLNPLNPSAPASPSAPDSINNIEQVYIADPMPGTWLVEVRGATVPSGPQSFTVAGSPSLVERGVRIRLPEGVPATLAPGVGATFAVVATASQEEIVAGSPTLHFRYDGGAFISQPLALVGGSEYQATLPPPVCGATPEFYVSVEGTVSGEVTSPSTAPGTTFSALVGVDILAADEDFETDSGYSVVNTDLTTGAWQRVVPSAGGSRGDPAQDYDGSGTCWVTGNSPNEDVDGGPTTLTSSAYDVAGLVGAELSVAIWFYNDDLDDPFDIELSDDDGASWAHVETLPPAGGWVVKTYDVADFVSLTSQVRVRFTTTDNPNNSVTEAAVDRLRIDAFICDAALADCNDNGIVDADDIASGRSSDNNGNGVPDECDTGECEGDLNGDGDVDLEDLSTLLSNFGTTKGATPEQGDLNGDGDVDLEDLSLLLAAFGAPCV